MKKTHAVILAFVVFGVLIYLFTTKSQQKIGLSGDIINEFKFERNIQGDTIFFTAQGGNRVMKIKKIPKYNEDLAKQYISDNIFVIHAQYREVHSPYPGRLSNRIECDNEFKPREINNSPFNYYLIYSTDRFTYGVCTWDLITYQSILYFKQCKEFNNFYQIQLFLPLNEEIKPYEEKLKFLTCN